SEAQKRALASRSAMVGARRVRRAVVRVGTVLMACLPRRARSRARPRCRARTCVAQTPDDNRDGSFLLAEPQPTEARKARGQLQAAGPAHAAKARHAAHALAHAPG